MDRALRGGSAVFAVGMAAMGILTLARFDFSPVLLALPPDLPGRVAVAAISGICLIGAAVTILLDRRPRVGALTIASVLSLGALLHALPFFTHSASPVWAVAFESIVLASAAWALTDLLGELSNGARVAARIGFAISLFAFGIFHFVYHAYIASVIPAWIPGNLFWTYGIGCALIAAGVAVLTGIQARLATTLLAIMFASWVVIVHAPRVAASPANADEWSSMIIALSCCGASLIMRAGAARRHRSH